MNFWHSHALIKKLELRSLSRMQKLLYLLGILTTSVIGFNTFFFIPNFYHDTMPYVKNFLEEKACSIQLSIELFDTGELYFKYATGALVVFFIILCYFVNRNGDNYHYLERMMCLSFPLTIRLTIIFSLIYMAICGSMFAYFFQQLMALQRMLEPNSIPTGFKGWLANAVSKCNIVKTISTKIEAMHKAQFIYEQISHASYAFHLLAHFLALGATFLFFFILTRNMYLVSHYQRSSQ